MPQRQRTSKIWVRLHTVQGRDLFRFGLDVVVVVDDDDDKKKDDDVDEDNDDDEDEDKEDGSEV